LKVAGCWFGGAVIGVPIALNPTESNQSVCQDGIQPISEKANELSKIKANQGI
jgi:hypothetical protein